MTPSDSVTQIPNDPPPPSILGGTIIRLYIRTLTAFLKQLDIENAVIARVKGINRGAKTITVSIQDDCYIEIATVQYGYKQLLSEITIGTSVWIK